MIMVSSTVVLILLGLAVNALAVDLPAITAAPQLYRRQEDQAFVGLLGADNECASHPPANVPLPRH